MKDHIIKALQAAGATEEQIQKATEELERLEQEAAKDQEETPRLSMEQFGEMVTEAVRKGLEPLTAVDRRFGVLPTDGPEDEGKDKRERLKKFLGAVIRKDAAAAEQISQRAALSEGVDSGGGYLVPEEVQTDVYRIIEQNRLIRQFGTVVTMRSDTRNLTSLTGKITAYWVGEEKAITASKPSFGRPVLYAKKLGGITEMSNELGEDSVVDVYDLVVELFAEAFGEKEDYEGLRGDGTRFTGILNHADAEVVTMGSGDTDFSDIDFDYLGKLIGKLTDSRKAGARFVFHRDMVQHLQALKSSDGQYLWAGATAAAGPAGTIRGYPWSTSDQMPGDADTAISTKFTIFGNLRWVVLGDRKAITIKVLEEGTVGTDNLGEQDMSALRIIERVGVVVLLGDCFAVLETAAS